MKRKWTKQSLKKALFSAGGRVLVLLLCLCSALSFCLPVSAATDWKSCEGAITAYGNGWLPNQFQLTANRFYTNYSTSTSQGSLWRIHYSGCDWTNQYSTHQHFTASFSVFVTFPANATLATDVWSSGVNARDNQNYWSVEQDIVTQVSYQQGNDSYVVFTHNITGSVQPGRTMSMDFQGQLFSSSSGQISQLLFAVSELRVGFSEDIDQNILRQLQNQSSDISAMRTLVEQIKNNSSVAGVITQQQATNQKLDTVNTNLQNLQQATEEQTQQQEEQYEQEKQEEAEREEAGQDAAEQGANIFTFTLMNPFAGIFNLFSGSGCVAIPTIGGMMNKPDATYCPWFSQSIRNILTPVIGLSSSMLLFGFIIRWLSTTDGVAISEDDYYKSIARRKY